MGSAVHVPLEHVVKSLPVLGVLCSYLAETSCDTQCAVLLHSAVTLWLAGSLSWNGTSHGHGGWKCGISLVILVIGTCLDIRRSNLRDFIVKGTLVPSSVFNFFVLFYFLVPSSVLARARSLL